MNIDEEISNLLEKLALVELSDKKNLYIINNQIKSIIEKNLKEIDIKTVEKIILSEKYLLNKKAPGLFIIDKMKERNEFTDLTVKIIKLFPDKQQEKIIAGLAYDILMEFRRKKWEYKIDESILYILNPYLLRLFSSNEKIKHVDFLIKNSYIKTIENQIDEKIIINYLEEKNHYY